MASDRPGITANEGQRSTSIPLMKAQARDGYSSVAALACQEQREDILNCFRSKFVEKCFAKRSDSAKVWEALKQSYQMHETMRQHELKMDKALFVEYLHVTGCIVSGQDLEGRPIIWFRNFPDVYKLTPGSPQESACIRLSSYVVQIAILKAFPGLEFTIVLDDSHRKLLDFNMNVTREITTMVSTLNPGCAYCTHVAGAHPAFLALWNLFSQVASAATMKRIQFMSSKQDILDVVRDRNDIPDWWFKDGTGRVSTPCFNTLWEWERCLDGGGCAITTGEIFNPTGPWEDVTWGGSIKAEDSDTKSSLQSIHEGE
jgi:CRAL/TRIO domain